MYALLIISGSGLCAMSYLAEDSSTNPKRFIGAACGLLLMGCGIAMWIY